MPRLGDPNFQQTVTYVCEHDAGGALGVVINRPMEVTVGEVFAQMNLQTDATNAAFQPVFSGGPVEPQRGFVIHRPADEWESTLTISDNMAITSSRDIVEAMAAGIGPARSLFAVGCAGWGAGQLEQELANNVWLTTIADSAIVFDVEPEKRWHAAARLIGVDIDMLSGAAGHA